MHYHYDGEEYCDSCLPVDENDPAIDLDQGEQDTPANCCRCHAPLAYSPTGDCVKYILDAMRESLRKGRAERNKVHDCYNGTHYVGCRHVEIVRDWADAMRYWNLDKKESNFVYKFLSWTEQ